MKNKRAHWTYHYSGHRIDAERLLNVSFFWPDFHSTLCTYSRIARKSLQRHPGSTFVRQIALVGTTITIDGHVNKTKEIGRKKRKAKNGTQNGKNGNIRARNIVACMYLFITKGTKVQRDNARINETVRYRALFGCFVPGKASRSDLL